LVPHQANRRIIDATASRMNLEESNMDRKVGIPPATLPFIMILSTSKGEQFFLQHLVWIYL
jgi:3-oxoacyl-[acyl-carrier-protein] synthase III